MSEFFAALGQHAFLQHAVLAGLLASVPAGFVGSFVLVRRLGAIAGGIAHCVLGGIGAARYLQVVYGWSWLEPVYGAVAAALLAAWVIGYVGLRAREREDIVIAALWAVGMAAGIVFIARTPGYGEDLMSYLFGNILLVSRSDLLLMALLDVAVLAVGFAFYNKLLAVCFDDEYAALRGVRVELFYLLLLTLTALTVVLLVTVVGVVLVIALLSLPVAIASHFAPTMRRMAALAVLLSVTFTLAGLAVSYAPDLPAGPTIILLTGAAYLVVLLGSAAARARRGITKRAGGGG
jgi:zinc transport system permease protein